MKDTERAFRTGPSIYLQTSEAWRDWLVNHHATENEIWLIFYKRHTNQPSIPYEQAVEEAICFGWVDSLIRSIDGERFARKFTPRGHNSKWSESNKKRVAKLIAENWMMTAGLLKIESLSFETDETPKWRRKSFIVPPEILKPIQENEKAWKYFNELAPIQRRNYIGWVVSAKKDETRRRRLAVILELLEQGKPLGMK